MSSRQGDNLKCPRCETTKYRNPNMKLMINECGHSLCNNCVEVEFVKGANNCYQCGRSLRKNNFRLQIFEDCSVEKEVDVRRRVLRDFNRREEEFSSLHEYNDYLEFVETIVFNLVNGVDLEATKRRMDDYKRKHRDQIQKNKLCKSKTEQILDEIIQRENASLSWINNQTKSEEEERKRTERLEKEKLIEDLTWSADGEADVIVAMHEHEMAEKRRLQRESEEAEEEDRVGTSTGGWGKATLFSTGDSILLGDVNARSGADDAGEPFAYAPLEPVVNGPIIPTAGELREQGFVHCLPPATLAELGGGFQPELAVSRAFTDAFCGLFMFSATAKKKRKRKKEEIVLNCGADESFMETSALHDGAAAGDVSLMNVSIQSNSRMSIG